MSSDPRGPYADRGGVMPVPYPANERVILTEQAKADRRTVPLLWLWRLTQPDEYPGTAPDDVTFEAPKVVRIYAQPIAVHLAIRSAALTKRKKKAGTETDGTIDLGWSRAEARRTGQLLETQDDAEGLVDDPIRQDKLFVPRGLDVFLWDQRYYEVARFEREPYGAVPITVVWGGKAAPLADDANAPGYGWLPAPPTPVPAKRADRDG